MRCTMHTQVCKRQCSRQHRVPSLCSTRALSKGRIRIQSAYEDNPSTQNSSAPGDRFKSFYSEPAEGSPASTEQSNGSSNGNSNGAGKKFRSSWNAKEAHVAGKEGETADYLYQVGKADYNINVDHGQNLQHLDYLFTGGFLGEKSDIADGTLRRYEFRTFNNIQGDYYIAPLFLEKIAVHVVKNFLVDNGYIDARTRFPLILGIWGERGMGKTFQTELAFKKLGMEPIVMSAGELENEWAGTPGLLIRERYRRAAEMQHVRGKLSCLLINDIDAGLGHFQNTQVTVNNQIVIGTLMNLCDDPNCVSVGGFWRTQRIARIPIIVTGNDFSRMFAPLIRDGRMDKFYWKPTNQDLMGIVYQMYKDDGVTPEDIARLLSHFDEQPLDFFGALRATTYDGQIREWIVKDVVGGKLTEDNANMAELSKRLMKKNDLPYFKPVKLTLPMLMAEGERLVEEQEMVKSMKLSKEYFRKQSKGSGSIIGLKG